MLDLQIISPDEPVEPDYVIVFTDLSDSDRLFQGCFADWSQKVKHTLHLTVMNKSISFRNAVDEKDPAQRRYVGDFYVVCQADIGHTLLNEYIACLQESVQKWRYYSSDTIFHLERLTYKDSQRWLHFILTNKPESFTQHVKPRPTYLKSNRDD